MHNDDQNQDLVKDIMLDIIAVLYANNIRKVHMGAMMRLLGVEDQTASEHDNELIELDENFGNMLMELNKTVPLDIPTGTTLH
jgi:hypothetical protein